MRRTILAGLAAAALSAAGCGGGGPAVGPSYGSPDGRKISELVDRFNDDKSSWYIAKKLFVGEFKAAPAQVKKYPKFAYAVKGDPVISGDTATAVVALISEQSSEESGDQTWTFVRDGDGWKIKDAPLP